jgi:hypothetical protein
MSEDNALDHLEEEIKELETDNPWGRVVRWAAGVIILVAVVAWIVWLVASPPASTSARMAYVPSNAAPIEMSEPRGTTLDEPPARFAWESVTGRFQYIARVYVKGTSDPIIERATTTSWFEPTPEERARMKKGKSYVWTVIAQAKDGSTTSAGQAQFKVR